MTYSNIETYSNLENSSGTHSWVPSGVGPATLACSSRQFAPYLTYFVNRFKASPAKFESAWDEPVPVCPSLHRRCTGLFLGWAQMKQLASGHGLLGTLLLCSSPTAGFSAGDFEAE